MQANVRVPLGERRGAVPGQLLEGAQVDAVLGELLEETDCTDADLLGHLRGPGPHTLGCWALDLILSARGDSGS
jgi:hypothetical protein